MKINNPFENLRAVKSKSILNGEDTLPDDIMELLDDEIFKRQANTDGR